MSDLAQPIELLSVARGTDLDSPKNRPVVILSIRTEPDRNWRFHHLSMSIAQAERLRDDLTSLLGTPATFILLAILALGTGCSARVEVVNVKSAAVEADSASAPPVATVEKSRTAVEIDLMAQPQREPAAPSGTGGRPSPAEAEGKPDVRGDVTLIVVKEVHKHRHLPLARCGQERLGIARRRG